LFVGYSISAQIGLTALQLASEQGNLEVAPLLLQKGAETEVKGQVIAVLDVHVGYGVGY
jgi:ankyrin repeat protein